MLTFLTNSMQTQSFLKLVTMYHLILMKLQGNYLLNYWKVKVWIMTVGKRVTKSYYMPKINMVKEDNHWVKINYINTSLNSQFDQESVPAWISSIWFRYKMWRNVGFVLKIAKSGLFFDLKLTESNNNIYFFSWFSAHELIRASGHPLIPIIESSFFSCN